MTYQPIGAKRNQITQQGGYQPLNNKAVSQPATTEERIGKGQAFVEAAKFQAVPSTAALAGGAAGAKVGATLGTAFGPVGTAIGGVAGAIAGGIGSALLSSKAQQKALEIVKGEKWVRSQEQKLAEARKQQPLATFAGEVAPSLLTMRPSLQTVRNATSLAQSVLTNPKTASKLLSTPAGKAQLDDLINVTVGGAAELGGEVYAQAKEGDFNATRLIAAGAVGTLINQPNRFGVRLGIKPSGEVEFTPNNITPEVTPTRTEVPVEAPTRPVAETLDNIPTEPTTAESIKQAKASGQSFDEWVKGQTKFGEIKKIDITKPQEQPFVSRFAGDFETKKSSASGLTYSTLDKMGSLNTALKQKGFRGVSSGDFKGVYSLDKVIDNPKLFEKYPQLKEINVYFADFHTPTQRGVHINNDIFLNSKLYAKDATNIESTLVHEIEHAIQDIEKKLPKFSQFEEGRGMNTKEYAKDLREEGARKKQQEYLDVVKTRSQLKAEWDATPQPRETRTEPTTAESIKQAKASGQSFDEWVKGQVGKTDTNLSTQQSGMKDSILKIAQEQNIPISNDGNLVLYHGTKVGRAPVEGDSWRIGSYFTSSEKVARQFAGQGEGGAIKVMKIEVPAKALFNSGDGSYFTLNEKVPVKSAVDGNFKTFSQLKAEWDATPQPRETRITSVPSEQLPVATKGELGVSRLEARVKNLLDTATPEKAEEFGVTTYNKINKPEQIKLASEFVLKNPEEAFAVLKGEKPVPKGILYNSIALAAEQNITNPADANLAIKLASLRSTRAGQEISILTEADPTNPVSVIDEIIKARRKAYERKNNVTATNATVKERNNLKIETKKSRLKIEEAEKLLNSILCKDEKLCLSKSIQNKLLRAFKDGEISIDRLYEMTDAERNTIFKQYVGTDFAKFVNGKFEQAMLSNQKKSLANWLNRTVTEKSPVRRDLLNKINKLNKLLTPDEETEFLSDLVEVKLGTKVTEQEAATIIARKQAVDEARAKIPETYLQNTNFVEPKDLPNEALAYGLALDDFQEYTGNLLNQTEKLTFKERVTSPIKYAGKNVTDAFGVARSLLSSWDLGLIGRQAWPLLLKGDVGGWTKAVTNSFKIFGNSLKNSKAKELFGERGDEAMRLVRASIMAQPNMLNGKFNAAKNKYGLDVIKTGEEAFPVDIPSRVPLLGRVFKASQDAYEGASLLMRAKLASEQIKYHESIGIDMMDEKNATALGSLVASLTGRGPLTTFNKSADAINKIFFAPRFMKGLWNTLTGHLLNPQMTPEIRRTAGLETLKIAAGLTTLLATAKMLGADVDFDSRNSKYGQICLGKTCIDVSGGLKGYITLGSRLVPTFHNGEWGMWSKSPSTGKYVKLSDPSFGGQNAAEVFVNFFLGKLAPGPALVRDWMKGKTFAGKKPTVLDSAIGLITPISGQTLMEEMKKGNDDLLLIMLAETFGFGTSAGGMFLQGERWQSLIDKKGDKVFYESTLKVTDRYNKRADRLRNSSLWKRLSNEEQNKALDKIRTEEINNELKRYGL